MCETSRPTVEMLQSEDVTLGTSRSSTDINVLSAVGGATAAVTVPASPSVFAVAQNWVSLVPCVRLWGRWAASNSSVGCEARTVQPGRHLRCPKGAKTFATKKAQKLASFNNKGRPRPVFLFHHTCTWASTTPVDGVGAGVSEVIGEGGGTCVGEGVAVPFTSTQVWGVAELCQ